MHGWGMGMGMGFMWIWWLIGLLLLLVIVWAIAKAGGGGSAPRADSAEQILRERYARGEIDREEYDKRLADLRR